MAAAMAATARTVPAGRRKPCWTGTPEVYFTKHIDNTRVVKMDDPQRNREMKVFGVALAFLCLLVLSYAWQHFKSIEYGYRIAELKSQRDSLAESNRALRLEEASLRSPDRIDRLAREMNMIPPQPGQVIRLDANDSEGGAPVMASVAPVSVVSSRY
jgi:cell division protein FtsL